MSRPYKINVYAEVIPNADIRAIAGTILILKSLDFATPIGRARIPVPAMALIRFRVPIKISFLLSLISVVLVSLGSFR